MNSFIQILSFMISFLYGIFFYLLSRFNKYILENKRNLIKFFITLVFIIDIVIFYIYIMYKINNGYFHIYFITVLIIGYFLSSHFYDKLKKAIKIHLKK